MTKEPMTLKVVLETGLTSRLIGSIGFVHDPDAEALDDDIASWLRELVEREMLLNPPGMDWLYSWRGDNDEWHQKLCRIGWWEMSHGYDQLERKLWMPRVMILADADLRNRRGKYVTTLLMVAEILG